MTDVDGSRRYLIRTFGCQMNEHDSERIAAQLEADGLAPATSEDDADVIVLNTCCIRENADNRLYGTLGHLKSRKDAQPGLQIVVSGCLAQKDKEGVRERAPYVDVVLGTHNVHRAADLVAAAREGGPITEILDAVRRDHVVGFEQTRDPLGVVLVHLTPEGAHEEAAGSGHDEQVYGQADSGRGGEPCQPN